MNYKLPDIALQITVVIPVYNSAKTLHRAVYSVLQQHEVQEVLLVEDGSVDESLHISWQLAADNKKIKVLRHKGGRNKGVSASRNLGIIHASNSWIAFLDADDYYLPNRFKITTTIISDDDEVDGVYEMCGVPGTNGLTPMAPLQRVQPHNLFESLQPLGNKVWFHINGLCVKKTIFQRCGLFDEKLQTSEDSFQWFKMSLAGKLVSGDISKPVAVHSSSSNGLSSKKVQVKADFIAMLLKLFSLCRQKQLNKSLKELVLSNLIYHCFYNPEMKVTPKSRMMFLLLHIVFIDPIYTISKSAVFRTFICQYSSKIRRLTPVSSSKV